MDEKDLGFTAAMTARAATTAPDCSADCGLHGVHCDAPTNHERERFASLINMHISCSPCMREDARRGEQRGALAGRQVSRGMKLLLLRYKVLIAPSQRSPHARAAPHTPPLSLCRVCHFAGSGNLSSAPRPQREDAILIFVRPSGPSPPAVRLSDPGPFGTLASQQEGARGRGAGAGRVGVGRIVQSLY